MYYRSYSIEIADAIKSFLTEDGISFSFDEEKGVFEFTVEAASSKIKKLTYIINVKKSDFLVYAISPIGPDKNDKDMMAHMASFVCLCNFAFDCGGNFDLNMNNGEIRYKYLVDCNGIIPTNTMIENSIYCPLDMFQYYIDGILFIIFNNMDPRKAYVKTAENHKKALYSRLRLCVRGGGGLDAEEPLPDTAEGPSESGNDSTEESEAVGPCIMSDLFMTEEEDAE